MYHCIICTSRYNHSDVSNYNRVPLVTYMIRLHRIMLSHFTIHCENCTQLTVGFYSS